MNKVKEYKYNLIAIVLFLVTVFLPPIVNGKDLINMNNDTVNHIAAIKLMETGKWDIAIYPWQTLAGVFVIPITHFMGSNIETVFMWFNYLVMAIAGILVAWLVWIVSKNKIATAIVPFIIIFGCGSTIHLFYSGTIFNIANMLILFPLAVGLIVLAYEKRKWWIFGIGMTVAVALTILHPSGASGLSSLLKEYEYQESTIDIITSPLMFMGIINSLLLFVCLVLLIKRKVKLTLREWIPIGITMIFFIGYAMLGYANITAFSSRLIINAFLMLGIVLCLLFGIAMNNTKNKKQKYGLVGLAIIGIVPNLVNWFTWTSFYNPLRGMY